MIHRTRIKICGLTREEDIDAVVAAGADAVGFVFAPGSPRRLTVERAAVLRRRIPPFVTVVGLFVNESAQNILECVDAVRLDAVQLHGEETVEVAGACHLWTRVIKAFRVSGPETLAMLSPFTLVTDAFLLDAWVPGQHGGTGARFDWEIAVRAREFGHPLILAGGLRPENVGEAVTRVRPFALDVSSGVESAPGIKDSAKIRRLIDQAWRCGG
jgi:phosphoribosylanthranilate isomerase